MADQGQVVPIMRPGRTLSRMIANIPLGSWAEWTTAGVTFLFFGATWLTISRDHKEKRKRGEDERQDQAELVRIEVVLTRGEPRDDAGNLSTFIAVVIYNNGRRQINGFRVTMWRPNGDVLCNCTIGSIPAKLTRRFDLPWEDGLFRPSNDFLGTMDFSFVDAAGTTWTRDRERFLRGVSERRHWYTPETELISVMPP
jgi:hypothetical protein